MRSSAPSTRFWLRGRRASRRRCRESCTPADRCRECRLILRHLPPSATHRPLHLRVLRARSPSALRVRLGARFLLSPIAGELRARQRSALLRSLPSRLLAPQIAKRRRRRSAIHVARDLDLLRCLTENDAPGASPIDDRRAVHGPACPSSPRDRMASSPALVSQSLITDRSFMTADLSAMATADEHPASTSQKERPAKAEAAIVAPLWAAAAGAPALLAQWAAAVPTSHRRDLKALLSAITHRAQGAAREREARRAKRAGSDSRSAAGGGGGAP